MSDKPLLERLQVKRERRFAVVDCPSQLSVAFDAAPIADVGQAEVVLFFAPDRATLDRFLTDSLSGLRADAIVWVAYPKLISCLAGDLSRDTIRALVTTQGLDTVSQIAIDDVWTALRLKRTR